MVKSKIKSKPNKGSKKFSKADEKIPIVNQKSFVLPILKKGRQTNNSLSTAVGEILIAPITQRESIDVSSSKSSAKSNKVSSQNVSVQKFGIEEEEIQVGMHKIIKILKDHEDSWPFENPVDEQYAPRYYSVVQNPMDLSRMEDKLDDGVYKTVNQFKRDFNLIVENCNQYNGPNNEYTKMAMTLKRVFEQAVDRYLEFEKSSDDGLSDASTSSVDPPRSKKTTLSTFPQKKKLKCMKKSKKTTKPSSKIKKKASENDEKIVSQIQTKLSTSKIIKAKKKKQMKVLKNSKHIERLSKDSLVEEMVIPLEKKLIKGKTEKKSFEVNSKESKTFNILQDLEANRSRKKEDFEESHELSSFPSNNSRKIKKNDSEDLDVQPKNDIKKSKMKQKVFDHLKSSRRDEKSSKKVKSSKKHSDKISQSPYECKSVNKSKPSKKKRTSKKSSPFNNDRSIRKISSAIKRDSDEKKKKKVIVQKDIESPDSSEEKFSKKKIEKKSVLEQVKRVKKLLHVDKKLSDKISTKEDKHYHNEGVLKKKQKVKSSKSRIESEIADKKSQILDDYEFKDTDSFSHSHSNEYPRKNLAIQALNEATEETLNDINKWLDDAPKATLSSDSVLRQPPVKNSSSSTSTKQHSSTKNESTSRTKTASGNLLKPRSTISKSKKIQRTIGRWQPGKISSSKKQLLNNNLHVSKASDSTNTSTTTTTTADSISTATTTISSISSDHGKCDETSSTNDTSKLSQNLKTNKESMLSLGTVLKNIDSINFIGQNLESPSNPNEDVDSSSNNKPLVSKSHESSDISNESTTMVGDNKDSETPKAKPNISAWFKAFGAPKMKKKEAEKKKEEEVIQKETTSTSPLKDVFLRSNQSPDKNQRRLSTGESSISESPSFSPSSFSQESPSIQMERSPEQNLQSTNTPYEFTDPQTDSRGAGFYQDAQNSNNSPYNSPVHAASPHCHVQSPVNPPSQSPPSPYTSNSKLSMPGIPLATHHPQIIPFMSDQKDLSQTPPVKPQPATIPLIINSDNQSPSPNMYQVKQTQNLQPQLVSSQKNLESRLQPTFPNDLPTSSYSMPTTVHQKLYPDFIDPNAKNSTPFNANGNNFTSDKKLMFDTPSDATIAHKQRTFLDHYKTDPTINPAYSQSTMHMPVPIPNRINDSFVNSFSDYVSTNPVFAKPDRSLADSSVKQVPKLPSASRSVNSCALPMDAKSFANYQSELELNLVQKYQAMAAATKKSDIYQKPQVFPDQPTSLNFVQRQKNKEKSIPEQPQNQQHHLHLQHIQQQQLQHQHQHQHQHQGHKQPLYQEPRMDRQNTLSDYLQYTTIGPGAGTSLKKSTQDISAFNLASTKITNSLPFYNKHPSTTNIAPYALLDDLRNPNLANYYRPGLNQPVVQQQEHTVSPAGATKPMVLPSQIATTDFPNNGFTNSSQAQNTFTSPVTFPITPQSVYLGVNSVAHQQYLQSLYALQPPPPHHGPSWL